MRMSIGPSLESIPYPERIIPPGFRLLEIPPGGPIPVPVQAEEADGEAEAVGAFGVLEPAVLREPEPLVREPGAAHVQEEASPDVLEPPEGEGEQVEEGETELHVGVE